MLHNTYGTFTTATCFSLTLGSLFELKQSKCQAANIGCSSHERNP